MKVAAYSDKLMILGGESASPILSLYKVEDVKKPLKKWKPIKFIEQKKVNQEWVDKFNKL